MDSDGDSVVNFLYCLIQHQEQLSGHSTLQGRAGSLQCTLGKWERQFLPTQEEVVVCPAWELMEGITNHCFVIVLTQFVLCETNDTSQPSTQGTLPVWVVGKLWFCSFVCSLLNSVSWLLNISLQDVYVAVYLSRCVLVF